MTKKLMTQEEGTQCPFIIYIIVGPIAFMGQATTLMVRSNYTKHIYLVSYDILWRYGNFLDDSSYE